MVAAQAGRLAHALSTHHSTAFQPHPKINKLTHSALRFHSLRMGFGVTGHVSGGGVQRKSVTTPADCSTNNMPDAELRSESKRTTLPSDTFGVFIILNLLHQGN
eukprot:939585-Amphidinium_carterae.2